MEDNVIRSAVIFLLLDVLFAACLSQEQQTASGHPNEADVIQIRAGGGGGVEEKVWGPLRVWHIVFLVGLVVVIAVTILCCCIEWRIPRTRQEIEETYRQRQMNQKYLRQLERNPDIILRQVDHEACQARSGRHHQHSQHHHSLQGGYTATHHHQAQLVHHQHHHRNHRHQQQQQHQSTDTTSSNSHQLSVVVTDTSARMARLAKSPMYGIQTPFALASADALNKQKQSHQTSAT